jgi:large subunit ribosomal protein L19
VTEGLLSNPEDGKKQQSRFTLSRRNTMDLIKAIESEQLREVAEFHIGDTVKVHYRIVEGKTERIQVYEGTVIARNNGGASETFTVRKISYGVGVERVFPLHSPRIERVEMIRRGRIRRSKLYYLRGRRGKAAKVRELIKRKNVNKAK